jgi:hypothetical protein
MRRLPLFLLFLLAFIGCSSDDGFYERASMFPSGIVETDEDGRIVSRPQGDTDWEVSPSYRGLVVVEPAFPNPARSASLVQIPVSVYGGDVVRGGLFVEYIEGHQVFRLADHPEVSAGGAYVLRFSAGLLGNPGLYRIYIVDGRGAIVSYGDVRLAAGAPQ